MKRMRRIATALTFVAMAGGLSAQVAAKAQADDPFEKLKTYDFQSRAAVDALHKMIQQAMADRAPTAPIELHLIAVLDDPTATFGGKQEACQMLWVIGSARCVPSLSRMLADEKLADSARYALERNTDASAGKALRDALPTAQGKTLVGIINSLGNRGDAEAVTDLKPFTTSSDLLVSSAAITALGKIGTESALTVLNTLPSDNLTVAKAQLRCAEHFAVNGNRGEAQRIYLNLAAEGRPAILRIDGLRGLVALKSARVSALAFTALKADDGELQTVAASICGSQTDAKATARAIALWPTLPPAEQTVLLTTLADRNEPSAFTIAHTATQSKDAEVRLAGIQSIGRVGGVQAVPVLVEIAMHGEGNDKHVAHDSLAGLPGSNVEQAILTLARSSQPDERAMMMSVLVDRPTPAALQTLLEAARGNETHVAVEAIRGLGRVGGADEHAELIKLLVSTSHDDVRDATKDAVVAIGQRTGDRESAAQPILAALPAASTAGKVALLGVLAEVGGDRALDELTKASAASDPDVKQAAITGLAESWSDARPLPTLLGIAKSDTSKALRVQALRGYLRLVSQDEHLSADDRVSRIAAALDVAERNEEKTQALGILRECRVTAAVELAAKLLDTPELFSEAADTVIYLAGPQKKGDRELAPVKGASTNAALDKIIQNTRDDDQKARAQKVR